MCAPKSHTEVISEIKQGRDHSERINTAQCSVIGLTVQNWQAGRTLRTTTTENLPFTVLVTYWTKSRKMDNSRLKKYRWGE